MLKKGGLSANKKTEEKKQEAETVSKEEEQGPIKIDLLDSKSATEVKDDNA